VHEQQYVRIKRSRQGAGALLADPQTAEQPINVEIYLKDVQLHGKVASAEQAQRAAAIAREIDGVKSVENK
jgi:osmotically-inducible protein OsmY